jgi:hypothetical protein
MIRVPFFGNSPTLRGTSPSVSASSGGSVDPEIGLEQRLSSLEARLLGHAEELRGELAGRVLRIQSRIESALRPFESDGGQGKNSIRAENVVEFDKGDGGAAGQESKLLHLRNAQEAMRELSETLGATRKHLEALDSSVERMRRRLGVR